MSEIPDDVMKLARDVAVFHCGDGLREGARAIAEAILDDRQRDQWQPIETAPRDGTHVLLYAKIDPPRDGDPGIDVGSYVEHRVHGFWAWSYVARPTHWKPLPAAPKGE